jgi:phosphoglycolate phosphatase-like HAD superfamily hydrolase
MVGDADVDVLGAHACDVDAILIRHSRSPAEDILAKARHVVASPAEAYAAVVAENSQGQARA